MKSIYISATEPRSGKSIFALGLMSLFKRRVNRVGFFKPISNNPISSPDEDVVMIKQLFDLSPSIEELSPLHIEQVGKLLASGGEEELATKVLHSFNKISNQYEAIVVEGTDYVGTLASLELDINAIISKTIDAPVLMVASGENRSNIEIIESVSAAKESFDEKGCELIGVVVTKVDKDILDATTTILSKELGFKGIDLLGVLPFDELLGRPRMQEIATKLNAEIVHGKKFLNNLVVQTRVAAMTIGNALDRFEDGMLLIIPADREGMIIAAMISRVATTYPNIAGIILCGDFSPSESVLKLIEGLSGFNIPIIKVHWDTFNTAIRVSEMTVSLYAEDTEKISIVFRDIQRHVTREKVYHLLDMKREPRTTPIVFLNGLIERARSNKKIIVLPEGSEERTLKAATKILSDDVAEIILLGDENEINDAATRVDGKIDRATIINPMNSPMLDKYAAEYVEIRKHKGMNYDHARDVMMDSIYFGTMMVNLGDADGLVSGALHTTRNTIKPAFQIIKTKSNGSIVSSVFFMCLEDRVLVYGDCAVNPKSNAEQLADIAITSAKTSKAFGFDPKVAMLSYSTGTSGIGPEVEKVKEATRIVMEKEPNLQVEGPIQYDAAISPITARAKMPESLVAGKANVLIFPDLNSGNTAYKAVQGSAKLIAVGPVLQGLNRPVNDLSRGCRVDDIVYTIAITAIQAVGINDA